MGTGKKKIEIKKIEKESTKMVTFSKRRKGLFKKAQELTSKTGANVAILVSSPAGRPYTFGNVASITAVQNNTIDSRNDIGYGSDDRGASTSALGARTSNNGLRQWLDCINIEGCNEMDELMRLKEQLQETKETIESMELLRSLLY